MDNKSNGYNNQIYYKIYLIKEYNVLIQYQIILRYNPMVNIIQWIKLIEFKEFLRWY